MIICTVISRISGEIRIAYSFSQTENYTSIYTLDSNIDTFNYIISKYGDKFMLDVEPCNDEDCCSMWRRPLCSIIKLWENADFGMTWGEWADRAGLIKKVI